MVNQNLKTSLSEKESSVNQQAINNKNYHLIKNPDEIDEWIKEAEEAGEVAVDTETNSLDPHQADLVGVSLVLKNW
jgi:DNA polymerase-1